MPDNDRGYGRKGGTSATAGRKSETIAGQGHSKRTFYGHRILVVYEGVTRVGETKPQPPIVITAASAEEAQQLCTRSSHDAPHTSRWFWCETVNGEPFTPPEA